MNNTKSYISYLKSPFKSIKHSTYFHVYDELFNRFRNKEIIFVEIGILGGGSLFMWRDFFGPKARIIGVDLNPKAKKWEEYGFEIFIGNQSDESFWRDFIKDIGPVDIVLDDGGHTYLQQIVTTSILLDNIRDNGLIVVEDTHTSYMNGFGPRKYSFIEFSKTLADKINYRFSQLGMYKSDKRIWSIQFFESIVVFHINKVATNIHSVSTNNNGIDDNSDDFRYSDKKILILYDVIARYFRFLKKIKSFKKIYITIRNFIANEIVISNSFKKYF